MHYRRYGAPIIITISLLLILLSFFAKDFVFYEFQMEPYSYSIMETKEAPDEMDSPLWFTYSNNNVLKFGYTEPAQSSEISFYELTKQGVSQIAKEQLQIISEESHGSFAAKLPMKTQDTNGDGKQENVYYSAKTDMAITQTYEYDLIPRVFGSSDIPFEVVFAERKAIEVFFHNEPIANQQITVKSLRSGSNVYSTNENGMIKGLSVPDIRSGIEVTYSPNENETYSMYYLVENYTLFSNRYLSAITPLLLVIVFTTIGIMICLLVRKQVMKKNSDYPVYSSERSRVLSGGYVNDRTSSKFMLVRWLFMFATLIFFVYGGTLLGKGQALNQVGVPLFSCPYNQDQIFEAGCYYLSHIKDLPGKGFDYVIVFVASMTIGLVFFGRIICGFLCPLGFIQDIMEKIRQKLKIEAITLNEKSYKNLQLLKWVWILLFLLIGFVGVDFCNICPNKAFSPGIAGFKVSLYLGGFILVIVMIGSFFIRRFWCIICPLGYIMGLFHRFSLFKLKKDCTACTECGACYDACPMRIKSIYTERDTSDIQTVNCIMCGECIHKCPENNALSMTCAGKQFFKSSRKTFMSRYSFMRKEKGQEKNNKKEEGKNAEQ